MLLCNTFSLAMFSFAIEQRQFSVVEVSLSQARDIARFAAPRSVVGHADTAKLFAEQLGVDVAFNRESVANCDEHLLVGQYNGPRLPEGVTTLPEGAKIRWLLVRIESTIPSVQSTLDEINVMRADNTAYIDSDGVLVLNLRPEYDESYLSRDRLTEILKKARIASNHFYESQRVPSPFQKMRIRVDYATHVTYDPANTAWSPSLVSADTKAIRALRSFVYEQHLAW